MKKVLQHLMLLVLAFVAGLLAWAVGPHGLLNKDAVSEIPAWILPGIIFGAFVLVPHSGWVSPGRAVAALGIGVSAWVSAFVVGGFGFWIVGPTSIVAGGLISGMILGLLVQRLIKSRQYSRYLVMLSFAGFLGSIPYEVCFTTVDWQDVFAPKWVIPSYIFWNMVVAIALQIIARREA